MYVSMSSNIFCSIELRKNEIKTKPRTAQTVKLNLPRLTAVNRWRCFKVEKFSSQNTIDTLQWVKVMINIFLCYIKFE